MRFDDYTVELIFNHKGCGEPLKNFEQATAQSHLQGRHF